MEPTYDNGKYGITENLLYLLTNKKNYINILNSKLFNFIFQICKSSGYHNPEIFKNIHFIQDNKTDKELYKIFKLTKDEIKIFSNVYIKYLMILSLFCNLFYIYIKKYIKFNR